MTDIRAVVGDEIGSPTVVAQLRSYSLSGEVDTSAAGLLTNFNLPSLTGALGVQTFTPESAVMLLPNTAYWFVLGVSSAGGSFGWSAEEGNAETGPGDLLGYAYSSDQGASFQNNDVVNPYLMQVDVGSASSVPEPSSLGMATTALLCGLCLALHRRLRSVAAVG